MLSFAHFFRYVQNAPWYNLFLEPALEELRSLSADAAVLDIGTGTGGFIEEVARVHPDFQIVGTDIDAEMLAQAQKRPFLSTIPLHLLEKDEPLPFADATFDAICFCSVLFLLDNPLSLLQEAARLLRPSGRIIILTPTGNGRLQPSTLRKIGINVHNWTYFIWRNRTAENGRSWAADDRLPSYAAENKLAYDKKDGFMEMAVVEVLTRLP